MEKRLDLFELYNREWDRRRAELPERHAMDEFFALCEHHLRRLERPSPEQRECLDSIVRPPRRRARAARGRHMPF